MLNTDGSQSATRNEKHTTINAPPLSTPQRNGGRFPPVECGILVDRHKINSRRGPRLHHRSSSSHRRTPPRHLHPAPSAEARIERTPIPVTASALAATPCHKRRATSPAPHSHQRGQDPRRRRPSRLPPLKNQRKRQPPRLTRLGADLRLGEQAAEPRRGRQPRGHGAVGRRGACGADGVACCCEARRGRGVDCG